MARKKRLQEVTNTPSAPEQPKEPVRYEDAFQKSANKQLEEVSKKFEGKGKTLLYAIGGVLALLIVGSIIYSFSNRSNSVAKTALGKAIETSQTQVSETPSQNPNVKTFKTEKERAEASIAEFQAVADKYGSPYKEKAQYFIATNRLSIDRAAAITELETLSKLGGEVGSLSKFALAQAFSSDGKTDQAVALYSELANAADSVVAKDTINFELASLYEKQGKKTEAADIFYKIAKDASEAKDTAGKPIPMSGTAREAKDKLANIDSKRAEEIKEAPPEMPAGMPIGM
jgi:tetratricopeptide (TPR) repeat protein